MKNFKHNLGTAICMALLALQSCKGDDNKAVTDSKELLTTVLLTYTNQANVSEVVKVKWQDIDGVGGVAPKIDNLVLKANTTYAVTTEVLDESKTPVENKTPEILSEGAEHQFFYSSTPANLLSVSYADKDSKNLPIGLATVQKTGSVGKGTFLVTLKHQTNLKSATSTIATGETDIEVSFNVEVK
jgi:hypothetical protein